MHANYYQKFILTVTPKATTEVISNNIIETKPIDNKKAVDISPSKTAVPQEKKPTEKKASTIVQVKSHTPPNVMTKVNVVEGKSSLVLPHPPLMISKVQVSKF